MVPKEKPLNNGDNNPKNIVMDESDRIILVMGESTLEILKNDHGTYHGEIAKKIRKLYEKE